MATSTTFPQTHSQTHSSTGEGKAPLGVTGVLDSYTGATAAYSTVLLYSTFKTDIVNVRRSGDNAERGFTSEGVVDGRLASWVVSGGGTQHGYVVDWYDQSGNGNTASQATAANQPQIVVGGSVVTENGKPAIQHPAAGHLELSVPQASPMTVFIVAGNDSSARASFLNRSPTTAPALYEEAGYFEGFFPASFLGSTAAISAAQNILYAKLESGDTDLAVNGAAPFNSTNAYTPGTWISITTDAGAPLQTYTDTLQAFVFYNSDQSANRPGIEAALNAEFSVY